MTNKDMMISKKDKKIRVRMAPSPTGSLHIGGVRTALYNILFAKQHGGTAVLRIEDTDDARSTKEFEQDILNSFHWAGIVFDEGVMPATAGKPDGSEKGEFGPYRQKARLELYAKYLQQLLSEHKAYYCFCTKEELEARRQSQESAGQVPKYSGKCRSYTELDIAKSLAEGKESVIRFKVVPEKIGMTDLIRGEVEFDNALSGDIVIAKSMSEPLYNFAVVIDDHEMQISHVIRGEEHLANTPKQIALAQALGFGSPQYAHLPLILSATGKGKMSKRDGGTTVREYREAGYLPEALINFLVLIGWHPAPEQSTVRGEVRPVGSREILSFEEMVELFSLDRVQKGGAKFDKQKLDFFNAHYIKQLSVSRLVSCLVEGGFCDPSWSKESLALAIPLVQERMVTLADFQELSGFFFELPEYAASVLVWKKSNAAAAKTNLQYCFDLLQELPDQIFTKESLEPKIMKVAEQFGKGDVLWPLRVAVSGKENSPPPVEILVALGKHESLRRLKIALQKLAVA